MENKIEYSELRDICKDQPLHFESDSSYGGKYYKCYITKNNVKYCLLCQIYDSTLEENNLYDELDELLYSNNLTFEWMNWDFYNLKLVKEDEIIYIKNN